MLNLFPIQFLAPFAYFILRVCVGIIFLYIGIKHLKNKEQKTLTMNSVSQSRYLSAIFGIGELVAGGLFVLGAYTQGAALLGLFLSGFQICFPGPVRFADCPPRVFFILLFFVSFSLFITGAGIFAFDLPL